MKILIKINKLALISTIVDTQRSQSRYADKINRTKCPSPSYYTEKAFVILLNIVSTSDRVINSTNDFIQHLIISLHPFIDSQQAILRINNYIDHMENISEIMKNT